MHCSTPSVAGAQGEIALDKGNGNTPLLTPEQILATLYNWLGQHAVLLPIPLRTKGPEKGWENWQNTTYEETQTPGYRARLMAAIRRGGNISVLLGNGLVSIDIDNDEGVDKFLELNPDLHQTLQSHGQTGRNIWLQLEGDYPRDKRYYPIKTVDGEKWGEFRSNHCHTVIFGEHEDSTKDNEIRYRCIVRRPTMQGVFEAITWPENLPLPWLAPKLITVEMGPTSSATIDLDKRILAYLAVIPGAVEGNGGDLQTYTVACELYHGFALSAEQTWHYLTVYNSRCEPPWKEKELRHKLDMAVAESRHRKPRGHLIGDICTIKSNEGNSTNTTTSTAEKVVVWDNSTTSTNLTGVYTQYFQPCIYPEDSILDDYMALGRKQCESADCFLLGSVLPVCAAILGRRVRFPWGSDIQFANLFNMLAGPPGSRKTSAISFATKVAEGVLPQETFMSKTFSAETLFDEFDLQKGGSPDKLWVVTDAKPVLVDWKKTSQGERCSTRFLDLYDCCGLTENFRRNASKKSPQTRRFIAQTSTSLVFGATFGDASFPGQAVQSGIARRFLFHVAEGMGREIILPPDIDIEPLIEIFSRVRRFQGCCSFTKEAEKLWSDFQQDNRVRIVHVDPRRESESHRLNSAPMQTLHVALIFEACIAAKRNLSGFTTISLTALAKAIDHVDACLEAAVFLDTVSERAHIANDAEILLAKVRKDFGGKATNGSIILTRSQITAAYAPHSSRQGSWNPDRIFLYLIPALIRQGNAQLYEKRGKQSAERYAFRCE